MKKQFVMMITGILMLAGSSQLMAAAQYTITDLSTLGGSNSDAWGINNSGHVVGFSGITGDSACHAFLYDGTAMHDLGTLGGSTSWAYRINNNGQVIGWSDITGDFANHAFLYDGDNMIDLNTLLPIGSSWVLEKAYSINDSGQIIGKGYINGQYKSFLMTPVPEPATLLLLGFGFAMLRKNIKKTV